MCLRVLLEGFANVAVFDRSEFAMILSPRSRKPSHGPAAFSKLVFVALPSILLAMQI